MDLRVYGGHLTSQFSSLATIDGNYSTSFLSKYSVDGRPYSPFVHRNPGIQNIPVSVVATPETCKTTNSRYCNKDYSSNIYISPISSNARVLMSEIIY